MSPTTGKEGREMGGEKGTCETKGRIRPDADVALRREMVRTGDVGGLMDMLATMRSDIERASEILKELGMAIGVRAQQDPEAFSREVYARMVALSSFLVLRCQYFVSLRIEAFSRAPWGMGRPDLPADIEASLARLRDLQEHVGELLQGQASVARSWALTRAKVREQERSRNRRGKNGRGRGSGRKSGDLETPAHTNGHSPNRLAGLLGGLAGDDGAGLDG